MVGGGGKSEQFFSFAAFGFLLLPNNFMVIPKYIKYNRKGDNRGVLMNISSLITTWYKNTHNSLNYSPMAPKIFGERQIKQIRQISIPFKGHLMLLFGV